MECSDSERERKKTKQKYRKRRTKREQQKAKNRKRTSEREELRISTIGTLVSSFCSITKHDCVVYGEEKPSVVCNTIEYRNEEEKAVNCRSSDCNHQNNNIEYNGEWTYHNNMITFEIQSSNRVKAITTFTPAKPQDDLKKVSHKIP